MNSDQTWNKTLNKKLPTNVQEVTCKKIVQPKINFKPILEKIRKLNEEYYYSQIKSNKLFHYSLKYRTEFLAQKAKQAKQNCLNNTTDLIKKSEDFHHNSENDKDQNVNFNSQNIIIAQTDDSGNKFFQDSNDQENDESHFFDEINKEIRNSILKNDRDISSSIKRDHIQAFGLNEEFDFPSKLVRINKDQPPKEKKFFKNIRTLNEYNASMFFDHVKTLDFKSSNTDSSLLLKDIKNISCKEKSSNVEMNPKPEQQNNFSQSKSNKTKPSAVKKDNFQRLKMKKKFRSSGYKRFNMKKYKFQSYRTNKKMAKFQNKCSKCASSDHIDDECDKLPIFSVQDDDNLLDNSFESLDLCLKKVHFNNIDDPSLDELVNTSLIDFGLQEFRANQKIVIKRILCGQSTLLISPTGYGKSLCYQLASYCFWKLNRYITIVVSPLISLMQDQIRNFPKCLRGVCYNSAQDKRERADSIDAIIEGKAQILFLSPECLVNGLQSIKFSCFPTVAFVCIDEAHCLAEWSTNFRPSYLHLYKSLKSKLNINTILALTATATTDTIKIVCKNLNLSFEKDVIGQTRVPKNLVLTVSKTSFKLEALVELLRKEPFVNLNSIIIYCTKRNDTERVASFIRTSLQFDANFKDTEYFSECYHAGLSALQRKVIQKRFISGKLRIVVATVAFGMGINKKDVRGIIHFNMPKSFENYLQEIGRAGRDDKQSYCHMFLDFEGDDLFALQNFIYANGTDKINLRKFVSMVYQPCKCRVIAEELDDDPNSTKCPGHPVSLPIFTTEVETDIKSEILHTLLMCLENAPEFPIQVLMPFNTLCQVINFGDDDDMEKLIDNDHILKVANVMIKRQCKIYNSSNMKFSVVDVARLVGKDPIEVRQHLKQLEWDKKKKRRKSNIGIRFSEYSYYINSPGTLTNEEVDRMVDYLYNIIIEFEDREIKKLRFVYSKFSEFISNHPKRHSYSIMENSDNIKNFLDEYFRNDSLIDWKNLDSSSLVLPYKFQLTDNDYASITYTIFSFICAHRNQSVDSPRKIARILQGISSPSYPAEKWSKEYNFWRSLVNVDFKELMSLCQEYLKNN